ncbi:MAG: glycosyltransferase family 4 protein, partial [Verrucomicrobiota bacterium]
ISGRLCPWKGQHVFLEAAAKLLERGRKIQFEILGGPLFGQEAYAQRLKNLTETCALKENVLCAGHVSDVTRRIRNWDILVHASTLPDPCPNVVLEAMAAGVPIVAANAGGVPELLDRGRCGVLFEADNPDALRAAIESLLDAPEQRRTFAQAARARALDLHQTARVAREMEQIWSTLLDPSVRQRRQWPWLESSPSLKTTRPPARIASTLALKTATPVHPHTTRRIP